MRVEARKASAAGDILLFGVIGGDFPGGEGITSATFARELKALGDVKTINLHIDSEGGTVSDAQAMYTLLVNHPARVVTYIDGWCCSSASFLAMAGSEIHIAEGANFMIHESLATIRGRARDLESFAQVLRGTDENITRKFVDRTGLPEQQIRDWMAEEKWFLSGAETVAAGFADHVMANYKIQNCVERPRDRYVGDFYNMPVAITSQKSYWREQLTRLRDRLAKRAA